MQVGFGACHILLDGDPAPPGNGTVPVQFSAHVYSRQTAGWIKMVLDMEVGFGPGHIVLDGDPAASPEKRGHTGTAPTQLLPHVCCGQRAAWIKIPLGIMEPEVGLGPVHIVLWGPSLIAPPKGDGRGRPPPKPHCATITITFVLRPLQVDRGRITQFKCCFQTLRMMR